MAKFFIVNKGSVIYTENRRSIGFVNIPPGGRYEFTSKEEAESLVVDSGRSDLKVLVEDGKS